MAETFEFKLKRRGSDESLDIWGSGAVAVCPICEPILGRGYPLWGVHLHAALALHAAHRTVMDLAEVPALDSEDRVLGRHLAIVPGERHG